MYKYCLIAQSRGVSMATSVLDVHARRPPSGSCSVTHLVGGEHKGVTWRVPRPCNIWRGGRIRL